MKVQFPSHVTGAKGALVVLEVEFTTKARRVTVTSFDGLEPLDLRGERPGGTYDVPDTIARLHVPMRVTRDGAGAGKVKVVVQDAAGKLPPDAWESDVVLDAPTGGGAIRKRGVVVALLVVALVAAAVYGITHWTSGPKVPEVLSLTQSEAEQALDRAGYAPVVRTLEEPDPPPLRDGRVVQQVPEGGKALAKGNNVEIYVARRRGLAAGVLDVSGKTIAEAEAALRAAGFGVRKVERDAPDADDGKVLDQDPKPGAATPANGEVVLTVGRRSIATVEREIPDVVGLTRNEAEMKLADAKFSPMFVEKPAGPGSLGRVTSQSPAALSKAPENSTVEVVVGQAGATSGPVPEVGGLLQADAEKKVNEANFVPYTEFVDGPAGSEGKVLRQKPAAGTVADFGTRVELSLARATGVPPTLPPENPTNPPANPPANPPGNPPTIPPENPPATSPGATPDLIGLDRLNAEGRIRQSGLISHVTFEDRADVGTAGSPEGVVLRQTPAAGQPVPTSKTIEIVVLRKAAATSTKGVTVPDVLGKNERDAAQALRDASFLVKTQYVASEPPQQGIVLRQYPPAGTMAEARTWAELFVGGGPTATPMPGEPPIATQPPTNPPPVEPPPQLPTVPTVPTAPPIVPSTNPTAPPTVIAPTGPVVPDVLGLSRSDAETKLRQAGFVAHSSSDHGDPLIQGLVVRQTPQSGQPTAAGARVDLVIVSGPGSDGARTTVPALVGRSGADAVTAALAAGLVPVVVQDRDPRAITGRVRDQSPISGASVSTGVVLRIFVGAGFAANEAPLDVPIVVGLSVADATARLGAAGLTVEVKRVQVPANLATFAGTDRVLVQWPAGRSYRSVASPVTVWVAAP